jgi:hypothetical protein
MNAEPPWRQVTRTVLLLAVLLSMRYIPLPIFAQGADPAVTPFK